MTRKKHGLSARGGRVNGNGKHTPIDSEGIDYSDIPPLSEKRLKIGVALREERLRRQAKTMIAIRIDPALLTKLRAMAVRRRLPYQTFIHKILAKAAN